MIHTTIISLIVLLGGWIGRKQLVSIVVVAYIIVFAVATAVRGWVMAAYARFLYAVGYGHKE